jgi:hypothetical protein
MTCMVRLRRGTVISAKVLRAGLQELAVEVDGRTERALSYPAWTGEVAEGSVVLLNTTAVALGLGTGGYHFVIAVDDAPDSDPPPGGHVMKLRYTPLQAKVLAVEEQSSPHHAALKSAEELDGLPVVWAPLHSMVAAAVAGARVAGARRVVFVMTDGAALAAWFSEQVHALRETGLVSTVITCGQALGGDLEAVNLFSALLAARTVTGADVAVVADGPGKVGTGTPWGASDVAAGISLNTAGILGGRPIAAIRLNFADPSYRHYGVSPHSLTVLRRVALVPVHVAIPALEGERREIMWKAFREARLEERHQIVEVTGQPALDLLAERGLRGETMGHDEKSEPEFFLAAGAAGVLAGRMAAGTTRWKQGLEEVP